MRVIRRFLSTPSKRIAVAISGGVDSAVTALLLQRSGYDVVGIHMQNWDLDADETLHARDASSRKTLSCFEKDEKDAQRVCEALNIPFHRISFANQYWNEVWMRVLREYQAGFTPNPDILCNQHIKAAVLPEYIKGKFGISSVATGHYARRLVNEEGQHCLYSGIDNSKDQAYFLCQITQNQLSRLEFPLGELQKSEVKQIASQHPQLQFLTEKNESMGVCFVGKRKGGFKGFLSQYIEPRPGVIRDKHGVVGEHQGLHTLTVGERARIGGVSERYYCIGKDYNRNEILVGHQDDRQVRETFLTQLNWISGSPPGLQIGTTLRVEVQLTNLGRKYPADLKLLPPPESHLPLLRALYGAKVKEECVLHVRFPSAVKDIAAGQFMAIFHDQQCLGSGKIYYEAHSFRHLVGEQAKE